MSTSTMSTLQRRIPWGPEILSQSVSQSVSQSLPHCISALYYQEYYQGELPAQRSVFKQERERDREDSSSL